jgi:hypothetical protein
MDNVTISIEESDETIEVNVSVAEQRMYPLIPIVVVETKNLMYYLEKNDIAVGALIKEGKAHNKRNHNRMGTWIFAKKSLDKPVDDVILKVEKEVKPKPARKRRTRSSTKKTSTEG